VPQRRIKLVLEFVSRTAGSGSEGAAPLNNKIFDNAVKGQAVIKVSLPFCLLPAFGQVDEIPNRFGALFGIKLGLKSAQIGLKNSSRSVNILFVVALCSHNFLLIR
jgi:hypothetical protein